MTIRLHCLLSLPVTVLTLLVPCADAQGPLRSHLGNSAGDRFGYSAAGAGDVDGDGRDDVIVGAYRDDAGGTDSGSAQVYSGATGDLIYDLQGEAAGDRFGFSVAGAGDVDGDGRADFVVGAPMNADAGSARVFSGADGSVLYTVQGTYSGAQLGYSVAAAGDIDGDGLGDVIVGAPFDHKKLNGLKLHRGSAQILSGPTGVKIHEFFGTGEHSRFGWSVGAAGDLDGDGKDDVVVGAPLDDKPGVDAGRVRVFSGATGQKLLVLSGVAEYGEFGTSVAGVADLDGDGVDDLIVGAPRETASGVRGGSVRVFSGADGSVLFALFGSEVDGNFGRSVSGVDDLDGDGVADLLVGAPRESESGPQSGRAYLVSGADGSVTSTYSGVLADDRFGWSVSEADVNGDGRGDPLVGAYGADANGSESGSALIFVGGCGLSTVYCTAGTSTHGCTGAISASGVASSSEVSGFTLSANGLDGAVSGLFYFAANGRQANPWANGSSQCVAPPLSRTAPRDVHGTPGRCNGSMSIDLNTHWNALEPSSDPGAGAVVQAQFAVRDPSSGSNGSVVLSDAIEFVVAP